MIFAPVDDSMTLWKSHNVVWCVLEVPHTYISSQSAKVMAQL